MNIKIFWQVDADGRRDGGPVDFELTALTRWTATDSRIAESISDGFVTPRNREKSRQVARRNYPHPSRSRHAEGSDKNSSVRAIKACRVRPDMR